MGSYFAMELRKQAAGLLCLAVVLSASGHLVYTLQRPTIEFDTVWELKDFAVSHGFYFHSGNANGVFCGNFSLADHPITLDDLLPITSHFDCGLTPGWRGILWVTQIHDRSVSSRTLQYVGGKWRIWGKILVAGDEDLMDRIEALRQ